MNRNKSDDPNAKCCECGRVQNIKDIETCKGCGKFLCDFCGRHNQFGEWFCAECWEWNAT